MSRIRPWTNGDQVALDAGRVPVYQDEKDVWLFDSAGNPIVSDADGNLPVAIGDASGAVLTLEPNGSVPVTLQDPTTPAIISPLFLTTDVVTMTVAALAEATSITLSSVANVLNDSHLVITNTTTGAFHICDAVGAPVGNVVTIDTPLAFPFGIGSFVEVGVHNIATAVGTLAAPVIYHARVANGSPVAFDVTRVMFIAYTDSGGQLNEFGDGAALINGIVLRKDNGDGTFQSIFNAKTNSDLMSYMYDFEFITVGGGGQDGFKGRLTFAGQNKMGVVIRLEEGTDLQLVIQDDLTTRMAEFFIIAEGHVVQP